MVYAAPKKPHRPKPLKPQLKQVPKNVEEPKKRVRPPKPPKQLKLKVVVRARQRLPLPTQKAKPVRQVVEPKPVSPVAAVHKLVRKLKTRRKLLLAAKLQTALWVKRRVKRVKKMVQKVTPVKQLPADLLNKK